MENEKGECLMVVDGEEFSLDKDRLASCSPVFEKMFFGLMATSDVTVCDVGAEEFRQLVGFVYTGRVEFRSLLNAWSLVYAANKYLISDLLDLCVNYIKHNLTLSTLLLSYEHAELYNLEKLMKTCLRDIAMYARGVFETSYHVKPSTWCAVLSEKVLNVDEKELVAFTLKWAVDECVLKGVECDSINLWKTLCDCNLTKFLNFSDVQEDLLSDEELNLFRSLKKLSTNSIKRSIEHKIRLYYQTRPWYKIYKNFRLNDSDILTTTVSVNTKVALFGVAVSTEHQPCDAADESYTGSFTVEIFKDNGCKLLLLEKIMQPFIPLKYDVVHYIDFKRIVVLETSTNYVIGVRYRNADRKKGLEVLCHYTGNITRHSVAFTFCNELYGSAVRGLAFYPF